MSGFINLHTHSHYSHLDASLKIPQAIEFCKDNGVTAMALTDHGTLSGTYKLWNECNDNDIKPILGIEAYYVDDLNKNEGLVDYGYSHICIFCKNKQGWENLKRLHFQSWKEGYLKKPRVSWDMLKKYHEGLIVSTACVGGLIGHIMFDENYYSLKSDNERKQAIKSRVKK